MDSPQSINDMTETIYQKDLSVENVSQAHPKYNTQLKDAMGVIPSWFSPSAPNPDDFAIERLHQAIFPPSSSDSKSIKDSGLLLTLDEPDALRQVSNTRQNPNQNTRLEPSNSDTTWFDNNTLGLDLDFTGEGVRASLSNDKMEDLLDVSDDTSQSNRMGSFHSRVLEASSHTSTGTDSIKLEADDSNVLDDVQDGSSRTSSLSSQLSPAKSTTPAPLQIPTTEVKLLKRRRTSTKTPKIQFRDLRPRTSIPSDVPHEELARQSVQAAYSSRLNPFALHVEEYQLLREHICHLHVTAYINVRNRILRLWVRNPLVSVTPEEAAGCAYSARWLGLAEVAYEWLVRKGYINFGCLEVPDTSNVRVKKYKLKRTRKTIVVIGAGMAGLGCARQLEGLLSHYQEKWTAMGEEPPRVIVLEGRSRIGGRIYSHPLQSGNFSGLPQQSRCTAEMGAHIITGFDHGNPLSMIIRGQLALHYYPLKDNSTLYDVDGQVVDRERDKLVEKLFNDILDRASVYRHRTTPPSTVEGDRDLIEIGRDPTDDTGRVISVVEGEQSSVVQGHSPAHDGFLQRVPAGVDKLTGKAHMAPGSRTKARPAIAAKAMGWHIASNILATRDFSLEHVVNSSQHPTLGGAMDEAVQQYQYLLDLSPQDMRLLNWHFANLEYANAVNVGKLSLGGWDQDIGNEFEGEHAQVIGGYQQVPRAIWQYPSKLDLQTNKAVSRIVYNEYGSPGPTAKIICDDGDVFEASHVILTAPLGVLKNESIRFQPELPIWKREAIERLGFGTLNKVILVFEKPFWNIDQDMIGLLRDATKPNSLNQGDYVQNRGRFYLFWNCMKTSGRPMLIALMAGEAAHQAELLDDTQIVSEVTQQLALMFKQNPVPQPLETIVTRWGKDRFACGSYSYVGATSQPDAYEAMAKPTGNLYFAGEATCGTHPATVHGAYISGLRAASEVINDLLGPINIPSPLVPAAVDNVYNPSKQRPDLSTGNVSSALDQARLEAFETEILKSIFASLGPRPGKPSKAGSNPFLLFTKDKWAECKSKCDEARRAAVGNPNTKASRNEVRIALGQLWREASQEVKQPYIELTLNNRLVNHESAATFQDRLAEWDAEAMSIRRKYVQEHPGILSKEEEKRMWQALDASGGGERRAKKMSGYADNSESEMDV
ncbi:MAG: hypothetical protein Q9187_002970 [Circinaria calcarea]